MPGLRLALSISGSFYIWLRRLIYAPFKNAQSFAFFYCNAKNSCFETPFLYTKGWFCVYPPVHSITNLSRFQTKGEVGLALGEDLSRYGNAVDCYSMIPEVNGINKLFKILNKPRDALSTPKTLQIATIDLLKEEIEVLTDASCK